MFVPTSYSSRSKGITAHYEHVHTHIPRSWPSKKEELDVLLALSRGCVIVESSRNSAIEHDAAAATSTTTSREKKTKM